MVKANKKSRLLATGLTVVACLLLPSVTNFTTSSAKASDPLSITEASSLWVVVNKLAPLNPTTYKPENLTTPRFGADLNANPYGRELRKEAAYAAIELAKAMKRVGKGSLVIQSGYRSFSEQTTVHERQVARYGLLAGEALAARPGYSEHQTGLAMDVSARNQGCQIRVCFGETKAGKWLASNAYRYGFIIRYPRYATPVTGYQYEPWHLRFVGKDLATQLHTQDIQTLEQFFKLPSAPNYP